MSYSRTRRSTTRKGLSAHPSLVAFLLVASFGILFAGCSGPSADDSLDEFSFTEQDIVRFRELAMEAKDEETGTAATLQPSLEEGMLDEESATVDLSMMNTYDSIRSGVADTDRDLYSITNEFLNVRSAPRVTAEQVDRLERGDMVELLEFVDAAWAKVKMMNGREGYVSTRYVAKVTSEEKLAEEKKKFEGQYFVNFGFLNVRKEADANSEQIGELNGQAIVKPLNMDQVWARVPFEGKEGYVAVQYLSPFLPSFLVRQDHYNLPVLQYRVVNDGVLDAMVKHIDTLKKAGYTIVTLRDFYNLLLQQEQRDVRLEPKWIVLAITDVDSVSLKEASDILRASSVNATFFIQTQHLGPEDISRQTMMTLLANGNDVQSGGHTGDDLRSLPNNQVELELKQSRKLLAEYTQKEVFAIAYPRGGVNDRVEERSADAGYLLGLGQAPDFGFGRSDFLHLPSYVVSASTTDEELLQFVRGE